jgi:hypothetical protein
MVQSLLAVLHSPTIHGTILVSRIDEDGDPLWNPYGPHMDSLWTPYGPLIPMDPLWSPNGLLMDPLIGPLWTPLWTPYGPPMGSLWTPLMDHLWTPYGPPYGLPLYLHHRMRP